MVVPLKIKARYCPSCSGQLVTRYRSVTITRRGRCVTFRRRLRVCTRCKISIVIHQWASERKRVKALACPY